MSVQATTWVWESADVSGSPLLVLLAIADAANREGEASCQSINTLVKMTRLSESTVHRAIKWLTEEGVIKSLGISPRYHTHVYCLPLMGGCQSDTPSSFSPTKGVSSTTPGGVTGDTQPQETNPKEPSRSAERTTKVRLTESEAFIAFYTAYPFKKARPDALKAWGQIGGDDQADCIMAGLTTHTPALLDDKAKGYCPYPAKWLRNRGWEDEVTPLRHSKAEEAYADLPRHEWREQQPGESHDQWQRRVFL